LESGLIKIVINCDNAAPLSNVQKPQLLLDAQQTVSQPRKTVGFFIRMSLLILSPNQIVLGDAEVVRSEVWVAGGNRAILMAIRRASTFVNIFACSASVRLSREYRWARALRRRPVRQSDRQKEKGPPLWCSGRPL
jgi:hypothetical protein